jgi:hypothetical protein
VVRNLDHKYLVKYLSDKHFIIKILTLQILHRKMKKKNPLTIDFFTFVRFSFIFCDFQFPYLNSLIAFIWELTRKRMSFGIFVINLRVKVSFQTKTKNIKCVFCFDIWSIFTHFFLKITFHKKMWQKKHF